MIERESTVQIPLERESARGWMLDIQDDAGGRSVAIGSSSTVVGSSDAANVVVRDPTVSKRHLELQVLGHGIAVRDCNSKNGTFIGTARVKDAWAESGTVITLGRSSVVCRAAAPDADEESVITPLAGVAGSSNAMRQIAAQVRRFAKYAAPVLIMGESGTGKELIARALHEQSARRAGPFLAVNCAAMPPTLLESELFGHVRGAFTDAKASRSGLFAQASGGTLFLDEIGELPLEMQPKLLRALQERTVRPVGGNEEIAFDARIVTATNRDLEAEVEVKRFREDLFYRINVVRIDAPALRDRGGDVLLLAQHFVQRFAARSGKQVRGVHAAAAERLVTYDWPGNVRELENCIERAVALLRFDEVTLDDLPEKVRQYRADRLVFAMDDLAEVLTIEELERRYIQRVLALVGGNKSRAADLLGLDRRTLYRRLDRYGGQSERAK